MVDREPIGPHNWREYKEELMEFARNKLKERGVKIGDTVVSDWNDELAYYVIDTVENLAIIGVPNNPTMSKTVLISSLFDPEDVQGRVLGMIFENLHPGINN